MSAQITSFLKMVFLKVLEAQNFENTEICKICKIRWSRELMQVRQQIELKLNVKKCGIAYIDIDMIFLKIAGSISKPAVSSFFISKVKKKGDVFMNYYSDT